MATGYFMTTNQGNIVPELWSKEILYQFYVANILKEKLTVVPVPYGADTTNMPTFGKLTAEDAVEGTANTGKYISFGNIQLIMDKHKIVPMTLTKKLLIQNEFTDSLKGILQERAGQALAYQFEVDCFSLYSSMSQTVAGLTDLTEDAILNAKQQIYQGGWNPNMEIVLVVSPYQYRKMMQLDNVVKASYYGNPNAIQKGILDQVYGVTVIPSHNVPTVSSKRYNIMFTRQYAMVGIQQNVEFIIDPIKALSLSMDASASMLYGMVETYDEFGVTLPTTN